MTATFAVLIAAARYSNAAMATYQQVMDETRAAGLTKIGKARRTAAKSAADKAERAYLLLLSDAGLDALPPEIAAFVGPHFPELTG